MNGKERPAAIVANPMLAAALSVEDGNRLIAEFMGYKYFQSSYRGWGFCKDEKDMSTWLHSNNILYHSSWDWLMPVIEKIESLWLGHSQPRCKIEGTYCQIADNGGYYAKNSNLKKFKILAVESEGMGLNDAQLNAIKAINLSNMIDIEARRRTLQEIKNDAVIVMNYNPDKLGYASPYKSNLSVENSIQMSNTQTLDEEKNYDLIVQNVMQNFYDMAVQVYGDNPLNTRYVNSDGDKAILELSKNDFTDIAEANMNIKIYNSLEAAQKLEQIKMDLLEQNRVNPGFLEPDEVVEVRMTSSIAVVMNVSRRAAKRRQDQMQQEQQQQQQLQQLLQESMDARDQQKQKHESDLLDKRLTVDKYKAELASDTLRKGFDVDSDGIDNASEAKTIEMHIKERIEKNKEILEYAKLNVEKQKIAKGSPRK